MGVREAWIGIRRQVWDLGGMVWGHGAGFGGRRQPRCGVRGVGFGDPNPEHIREFVLTCCDSLEVHGSVTQSPQFSGRNSQKSQEGTREGWAGWGWEQPGVVGDVPGHGRNEITLRSIPIQTIPGVLTWHQRRRIDPEEHSKG